MSFPVVIHHNPGCRTSRNVLRVIRAAGYAPAVLDLLGRLPSDPLAKEDGQLIIAHEGNRFV